MEEKAMGGWRQRLERRIWRPRSARNHQKLRFLGGASGKEPACRCRRLGDSGSIPGSGRPLEEGMATHSSTLAWRIPWTEEPGGLESIRSRKSWKQLATKTNNNIYKTDNY